MSVYSVNDASQTSQKWLAFSAWLIVPPLFGLAAVLLGQDANWDLRNYHYYNPYAFLNHRMDFDILPSQVANFYNPLLYVPFYYVVKLLPPKGVGFFLGWIQGMNFPLILAIARQLILPADNTATSFRMKELICFGVSLVGMSGAGNISELGTVFSDNLLSLLILLSLLLILSNMKRFWGISLKNRMVAVIIAGFLAGTAAGLKQPAAIFSVGLCAAFFFLELPFIHRFWMSFVFGIGVLVGIAASGGYWLYKMWEQFRNPFFPYFNLLFQSPMATIGDYRDARFIPVTPGGALISPFFFGFAPYKLSEVFFQDLRIPLLYVMLLAAGVHRLAHLFSVHPMAESPPCDPARTSGMRFLLAAGIISYLAWMRLFGIFRYALIFEMLAPLGIWMILDRMITKSRTKLATAGVIFALILGTLVPADWGRVPWAEDYFGADIPAIARPEDTIILMTGTSPTSYLIPLFPKEVRFIRIQSYFTGPSSHPNGFDLRMRGIVAGHTGPLYVLYRSYEKASTILALQAYGLKQQKGSRRVLQPHIESEMPFPLYLYSVSRNDPA